MTEQQPPLIPLKLGEKLGRARNKQKIKIETAAENLKIDLAVLQAMEEDRLDHLAPVYRRGYLSAYARYLKFKPADIEQMLELIGNEQPRLHTVFPEAGDPNQADRWLKAASYVLASLLVGTLAWQFTHEAVRLSQSGNELVSGTVIPQQQAGAETGLADNAEATGGTHVNASIAALDILREQRESRKNTGNEAWAALQSQDDGSSPINALPDGEYTLDLTASGDSWVEITDADGQQLELDLVRAGQSKQYRGKAPFSIQFGRASAISLYLDGQAVDLAPFTTGDVTQMTLGGAELPNPGAAKNPAEG